MRARTTNALLANIAAASLAGCGGGGPENAAATIPPPPVIPTPTPTPTILSAAKTGQEFASKGTTYFDGVRTDPKTADSDQLKVRYEATSGTYEIQLPAGSSWLTILPDTDPAGSGWKTTDGAVRLGADGSTNVSLVYWSAQNSFGVTAVAIPTPASAIPRTGSGQYSGSLAGYSSERVPISQEPTILGFGTIRGTINLTFDFATGALGGSIAPTLFGRFTTHAALPTLSFTDTVHTAGSPNFSGRFDTGLAGANSFSGVFAGPGATEVGGNFAFPYLSPIDGTPQEAAGAFSAHQ